MSDLRTREKTSDKSKRLNSFNSLTLTNKHKTITYSK